MNAKTYLNMYCEVYYTNKRWKTSLVTQEVYSYLLYYAVQNIGYNFLPYRIAVKCGCYCEGSHWEKCKIEHNSMMFRKCFVFRGENTDEGIIRYMCEWRKLIQSALDWDGTYAKFDMDSWWKVWKQVKVRILFEVDEDNGKGFVSLPGENLKRRK